MPTIAAIALVFLMAAALPAGAQTPRPITSFETAEDLRIIVERNVRAVPVREGATDGSQALRVTFNPAEWPNVLLQPEKPWDWRGLDGLAIDVANPGPDPIEFGVRVDDDPSADGNVHSRQGTATLQPGERDTFVLPLGQHPMDFGMRGVPTVRGVRTLTGTSGSRLDLSHVLCLQVFLHAPPAPRTLVIDNLRLVPYTLSLEGIVDEFGQYTGADWPGKLKRVEEFDLRRISEAAELKRNPELPDRNKYGGWTKGPKLKATGFFRAEKVEDKWWLVDPEGRLFFSMGMDCVSFYATTITAGRERFFTWLPQEGDPLARHAGYSRNVHSGPVKEGADFNFFTANLERKYGRDYEKLWMDNALVRLRSWGFNTIGNWSDGRLYGNGRVPYVATAHIGGSHATLSSGSDYWGQMHDPFDPQFAADAEETLRGIAEKVKGDPWCLGYFVDNELSWGGWGEDGGRYGLAYGALAAEKGSPGKAALVSQLKRKYETIEKLNAAWGTQLESWSALDGPFRPQGSATDAMKADLGAFVKTLARRYFRIVRDTIRKLDPDHMYLGCRFAWRTPEAVEAAAEICDVVSFNFYLPRISDTLCEELNRIDRPCIIGEFHFGALDRGMLHTGLVAAPDQKARAAMYQDYLRSVLDCPALVGCHWFQYVDEPLTGRSHDGENYNIGFVTVTDTPYPEMVAAARQVHAEAYQRRYGKPEER